MANSALYYGHVTHHSHQCHYNCWLTLSPTPQSSLFPFLLIPDCQLDSLLPSNASVPTLRLHQPTMHYLHSLSFTQAIGLHHSWTPSSIPRWNYGSRHRGQTSPYFYTALKICFPVKTGWKNGSKVFDSDDDWQTFLMDFVHSSSNSDQKPWCRTKKTTQPTLKMRIKCTLFRNKVTYIVIKLTHDVEARII